MITIHGTEGERHPQESIRSRQGHGVSHAMDAITPSCLSAAESICAIVVAYFPDGKFGERVLSLLPQVAAVVIVDNTPSDSRRQNLMTLFEHPARVCVIENPVNTGIAAALNQGLDIALKQGCNWILTLDQDTQCRPDMVQTLMQVYAACERKPAVIGGNYIDPRNSRSHVPVGAGGEFLEQQTVITSGSLIDAHVARSIGGFREDYFIDQVDHEFCLRMRGHGCRVVISRKPVMEHSVGGPGGVWLPLLGSLPNHPPLRKYYITRNTLMIVAEYWRQEPEWCARRLARLLLGFGSMALLEKHRLAKVRAFAAGVADGICRRMGPCQRKWLHRS